MAHSRLIQIEYQPNREIAMLRTILTATASAAVLACVSFTSADALTMQECSVKYRAAQKANTLKGQKWNDFRKAECGDDDAAEAEAANAVNETTPPAKPAPVFTSKSQKI